MQFVFCRQLVILDGHTHSVQMKSTLFKDIVKLKSFNVNMLNNYTEIHARGFVFSSLDISSTYI